ncbi:MAG: hypothetical protein WAT93_13110 [Pontixanthobacter sp.]
MLSNLGVPLRAIRFNSRMPLAIGISVAGVAALGAAGYAAQQQSPPIARYTMDAGTTSGLGAMGGGMQGAMAMLTGRGNGAAHELILRLGSSQSASGGPKADHFMPPGAALGNSVPLVTPIAGKSGPPDGAGKMGELPKARLYIFWGCGEHAPKNQPLVIDFTKLAKGQIPSGLYAQPLNLPDDWKVLASDSKTYGDWPNGKDAKVVPGNASLRGAHRIESTYAPKINFMLDRDFMPALQTQSQSLPSGAYSLSWKPVADATGYYAWGMSAKLGAQSGRGGDVQEMVWWSSSATQQFGGAMWDWLSPAAVAELVAAKTVMPPSQTNCTVPAEVKQMGGEMTMANLSAYGPQSDFAYPPRPTDAKIAWKPEWIARVRFRSTTMLALGMPNMGDMRAGENDGRSDNPSTPPQSVKPKCKGLAGIAKRAAGLCE